MTNESTEAVIELCLRTQHENTKRAICRELDQRIKELESIFKDSHAEVLAELEGWVESLKLEDTK